MPTFNASARKLRNENLLNLSKFGKSGNGPTFNASAQKLSKPILDNFLEKQGMGQQIENQGNFKEKEIFDMNNMPKEIVNRKMLMVKEIVQLIIPDEQPCFDLTQISTKMEQLCEGL